MKRFRVWYQNEYLTDDEERQDIFLAPDGDVVEQEYDEMHRLDDAKVEFYSGKFDKHGTEMAENDIVRWADKEAAVSHGSYDNMMVGEQWEHGNGWHLVVRNGKQEPATYILTHEITKDATIVGNLNEGIKLEYQKTETVTVHVLEVGKDKEGMFTKVEYEYKKKTYRKKLRALNYAVLYEPGDEFQYEAKESVLTNKAGVEE